MLTCFVVMEKNQRYIPFGEIFKFQVERITQKNTII